MAVDEMHSGTGPKSSDSSSVHKILAKASIFGLRRSVLIGICVGCVIGIAILFMLCVFWTRCSRKRRKLPKQTPSLVPMTLKDITALSTHSSEQTRDSEIVEAEKDKDKDEKGLGGANAFEVIDVGVRSEESKSQNQSPASSSALPFGATIGWGQWYTLRELEVATGGFAAENIIGEGGYGVVYRGVLPDGSVVAVKNIFNNKGQAEKEFKVEVEAIGKVKHKNLVGLIGYCAEGAHRLLVYEYVDNGNLEQWLHGDVGPYSPLTWDIRMKIAIGTAKGLAYLHEGLEPKVVHRDIKSSNILLDKKWTPKVSDFGLAKLLGSDKGFVTTRIMGTFGYVAPEYASSGKLNEGNDVYSFGVLLMEIISGRAPVDHARPAGEVNLVDWFKRMIGSRQAEELVDPLIEVKPSSRELKRLLLVCLRCIDLDTAKRPRMGQVVHMIEADDFPFRAVSQAK